MILWTLTPGAIIAALCDFGRDPDSEQSGIDANGGGGGGGGGDGDLTLEYKPYEQAI